jgi:glycosyltransferase involved in cell wall biosynthesis
VNSSSSVVLIPAYNPGAELSTLVSELDAAGYKRIVLVNDGSENSEFFPVSQTGRLVVLSHAKNMGKGAALKTGFQYILENFSSDTSGIITVDADGQHLVRDVLNVDAKFGRDPESLVLGVREFDQDVPFRSALGNRVTSFVLDKAENIELTDTQTGLRALSLKFVKQTIDLRANHYEFELECLVLARRQGIKICEVPITTVYHSNNESSHFRPLLDSVRVYSVFSRFLAISLASFLIDIVAFWIVFLITSNVYVSTYSSRSVSATINFLGNKYLVFRSHSLTRIIWEGGSYLCLVFLVASVSAFFVQHLYKATNLNILVAKVIVDISLFFMNFFVQKHLLFKWNKES